MTDRFSPAFTPDCTRRETIFGWVYLLLHIFGLPMLLAAVQLFLVPEMTDVLVNILYYGISLAVVVVCFWKLLRREFDHLLDRPFHCIRGLFTGFLIWYLFSLCMVGLLESFGMELSSPNDEVIDYMAQSNYNVILTISVIAAPILEEVLFRGIAFQSLRKKSRALAYIVSMTLFCIYHVWQFALLYGDATYLLYAVQYLPITFALTWSYEYSGSLWTPILFHMSNNWMAMSLQQMM